MKAMYTVVSLADLNTLWCSERVIELLDQAKMKEAEALASEWGYQLEGEVDP